MNMNREYSSNMNKLNSTGFTLLLSDKSELRIYQNCLFVAVKRYETIYFVELKWK